MSTCHPGTASHKPHDDCKKHYPPIEDHGLIGNMRTAALSGVDGSINFMCYPNFDSPSIFARLLDKNKGGYFSINPIGSTEPRVKQQYLPNTNILTTRHLEDNYSVQVSDFFHHPASSTTDSLRYPWLVRQAFSTRGQVKLRIECFPGFDYSRAPHETKLTKINNSYSGRDGLAGTTKVEFISQHLSFNLSYLIRYNSEDQTANELKWSIIESEPGMLKGPGVVGEITLFEGQEITFLFGENVDEGVTLDLVGKLFDDTFQFWQNWSNICTYKGRWRESVLRSALTLKLMTYAPTGAIVASPTFSLPESIGGKRNWDYRYSWVRDSSFTIYAFIRLGFTNEAKAYMRYIQSLFKNAGSDGSLKIMYDIHGNSELDEIELEHWEGYCGSSPVRIGNGAADHLQLDIYGELLDAIYLFNKFASPISYDSWVYVRRAVDYVCENWTRPDMSIWEVRDKQQNFVYSKIMCWVAVDRGLRLSEKRTLPCPRRNYWLETRDRIYEEIMTLGWNDKKNMFCQSYENQEALDASVLIMPLVFFISPTDPRLLSTIDRILLSPEKGGLLSNNLVYRYNISSSTDGVEGKESSFSMCTFWLVEALTRAGAYEPKYLPEAINIFEQMLGYANHLELYSEEIAPSGRSLGNFPQAFTHIALISAASNLDRVLD